MTITNGYCTQAELKRELATESLDIVDDEVLDDIITDASRAVDVFCDRRFYPYTGTRWYDVPPAGDRALYLDEDLIGVTGASNGSGAALAAGDYYLWPRNAVSKAALVLVEGGSVTWQPASSGNSEAVIAVAASWGYVDRAASDARSAQIVRNTRRAALATATAFYRQRFGRDVEAAQVTAAGVVLTPQGIPKTAAQLLEGYRRQP